MVSENTTRLQQFAWQNKLWLPQNHLWPFQISQIYIWYTLLHWKSHYIDIKISYISEKNKETEITAVQAKLKEYSNIKENPVIKDVKQEKTNPDNINSVPIEIKESTNTNPFINESENKPDTEKVNDKEPATEDACYACDVAALL